jgi:hypothetical protein
VTALIVFGVLPLMLIIACVFMLRRTKQLKVEAVALAKARGFEIEIAPKRPPSLEFDLFALDLTGSISFHTWRRGSNDSAFDYSWWYGPPGHRGHFLHSCAVIEMPLIAPHLVIADEAFWAGLGRKFGVRDDVEIESADFNDHFRVRCDDDTFAKTLLDQRMIDWMLTPYDGLGTVKFEFLGQRMLCFGNRVGYPDLLDFFAWAQQGRMCLPDVLTDLYPPQ